VTAFLWKHNLTYVSAPKVACTSLKHMFFEIENGFRFRRFYANGKMKHIHGAVYPGYEFDTLPHARIASHVRLTVVRDPVKRLLSCYSNRVIHFRELGAKAIAPEFRERGATPDPSLEEFVDKLELYCAASRMIRRHSLPLVQILGPDPSYYERVYSIDDLEALRGRVAQIVGEAPEIRRLQTGGPKLSVEDLDPARRRRVEAFYAEDYATYGGYF